jgi:hypothetical protein
MATMPARWGRATGRGGRAGAGPAARRHPGRRPQRGARPPCAARGGSRRRAASSSTGSAAATVPTASSWVARVNAAACRSLSSPAARARAVPGRGRGAGRGRPGRGGGRRVAHAGAVTQPAGGGLGRGAGVGVGGAAASTPASSRSQWPSSRSMSRRSTSSCRAACASGGRPGPRRPVGPLLRPAGRSRLAASNVRSGSWPHPIPPSPQHKERPANCGQLSRLNGCCATVGSWRGLPGAGWLSGPRQPPW